MLSSEHGLADVFMDPQQLWLPTRDQASQNPRMVGGWVMRPPTPSGGTFGS